MKRVLLIFLVLPIVADEVPKPPTVQELQAENAALRKYIADTKAWNDKNTAGLVAAYRSCMGDAPQEPKPPAQGEPAPK